MRFTALSRGLTLSALGLSVLAIPAFADDAATDQQTLHKEHVEERQEHRAFHHLSDHGQKAMAKIIEAQGLLAAGEDKKAIPALNAALSHLDLAAKAREKFTAAEADLHPAPQHPVSKKHTAQAGPTDWIPVGGEVIATTELEPTKKSAIATANAQLKAGQTELAAQTLQVVGEDIDFIIALAPLSQLHSYVSRALTFAQANQPEAGKVALDDAIDSLVFVSENVVTEATANQK